MKILDIITLSAILLGPIIAVQLEKFLERRRDSRSRKVDIFKTLMATRGSSLSIAHVEALNRIDLEFSNDKTYKKVVNSWKEYFDNLNQQVKTNEQFSVWSAKNEELLANLLYEMGQSLGYKFDKVLIKRNIYSPIGHAQIEKENEAIRKGWMDLFNSETSIPMSLINDEATVQKQVEVQELLIEYLKKQIDV